jgi:hypothetical protein
MQAIGFGQKKAMNELYNIKWEAGWQGWLDRNPSQEELRQTMEKVSQMCASVHPNSGRYTWLLGEIAIRLRV